MSATTQTPLLPRTPEVPLLPQFTASSTAIVDEFRATLAEVRTYPNRWYWVRRRILLDNLFGVDIMAEAVELCKMRLHAALLAVLPEGSVPEPLPDLSDRIKCGNTLVGYATVEQLRRDLPPERLAQITDVLDEIEETWRQLRALEEAEHHARWWQQVAQHIAVTGDEVCV